MSGGLGPRGGACGGSAASRDDVVESPRDEAVGCARTELGGSLCLR